MSSRHPSFLWIVRCGAGALLTLHGCVARPAESPEPSGTLDSAPRDSVAPSDTGDSVDTADSPGTTDTAPHDTDSTPDGTDCSATFVTAELPVTLLPDLAGAEDLDYAGDVDGDGTDEVIGVVSTAEPSALWLVSSVPGQGAVDADFRSGTFGTPGDVDGDGTADLLVTDPDSPADVVLSPGPLSGPFDGRAGTRSSIGAGYDIAGIPRGRVDGDGDGLADLVFLASVADLGLCEDWMDGAQESCTIDDHAGWSGQGSALVGDVDGSGRDFLAIPAADEVWFVPVPGEGGLGAASVSAPAEYHGLGALRPLGDLDGDGIVELAAESDHGRGVGMGLLRGGSLESLPVEAMWGASLAAGDLDGDGQLDLVYTWDGLDGTELAFAPGPVGALWPPPYVVTLPAGLGLDGQVAMDGDWDGDGVPDVVLGGASGAVVVRGVDLLAGLAAATEGLACIPADPDACTALPDTTGRVVDAAAKPLAADVVGLNQATTHLATAWDGVHVGADSVATADLDADGQLELYAADTTYRFESQSTDGIVMAWAEPPQAGAQLYSGADQVLFDLALGGQLRPLFATQFDGAPGDELVVTSDETGEVYALPGGPDGIDCGSSGSAPIGPAVDTVAGLPDLDGDGRDELAFVLDTTVGLVSGGWSGAVDPSTASFLSITVANPYGRLALAGGEDLDGDGIDDLVAGNRYEGSHGSVAWLSGASPSPVVLADDASGRVTPDSYGYSFGKAVASPGDENGDGYADVVVAGENVDEDFAAVAWLLPGPLLGDLVAEDVAAGTVSSPTASVGFQRIGAADVDGDGTRELVLGTPYWPEGTAGSLGTVWILPGAWSGTADVETSALATVSGVDDRAVVDFRTLGDLDGNGTDDLLVFESLTGARTSTGLSLFLFSS